MKKLPPEAIEPLCAELREAILDSVSQNGGHLASNLGAVELTVALHRVYDTDKDRVVFDVGHQSYAHKMLTGRLPRFETLRQYGGLSGFPKPGESDSDACISGHASNSISLALGMARARTLSGGDYDVCAVIGDGALTGGLAYEGLSDCGASKEPMLVILNDNEMSISSNVGGLARMLARQRIRPSYLAVKRLYHNTIGRFEPVYRVLHAVKEWIKDLFLPDNMFEDMGFYYLGPIDGHDVKTLEHTITYARSLRVPVLLHVHTVKGKGYSPAESSPELYHGVGAFDLKEGVKPAVPCFSDVFGEELCRIAAEDRHVVAITAAMAAGTGLSDFAARFPERFFDVGIAEGHAAAMAAGLAKQGMHPVFAVYSTFLQRGFDMLIHDVGLAALPVVFAVDRTGLVGADGETHQGSFDVGYLRQVPNMRVYAPSSFAELRSMLRQALDGGGPAALRYPRGGEGDFTADCSALWEAVLRDGTDLTIVSYGTLIGQALSAADTLAEHGVHACVIKLNRLDGDAFPAVEDSVRGTGRLIVAEETAAAGCVGEHLVSLLAGRGVRLRRVRLLNLGSGVIPQGEPEALRRLCGIDAQAIIGAAEEFTPVVRPALFRKEKALQSAFRRTDGTGGTR